MSRLTNARDELERYEQTKPADYQSKYQGQINDVMSKLNDLGEYDYDPAADTAYQQYKSQYAQKAKLANQNAQANASAMTGGYGSSYGTQAGQKAYAATMDDLDSVLDGLAAQNRAEYNTKKERAAGTAERAAECRTERLCEVPEGLQPVAGRAELPAERV